MASIEIVNDNHGRDSVIAELLQELRRLGHYATLSETEAAIRNLMAGTGPDVLVCAGDLQCVPYQDVLQAVGSTRWAQRTLRLVMVDWMDRYVPEPDWSLDVDGYVVASSSEQLLLAIEQLLFRASPRLDLRSSSANLPAMRFED